MSRREWVLGSLVLAGLAIPACVGSRSDKGATSERVTLPQLSAPARGAVERLTMGGTIERIDRETEAGRVVYDVEANVAGKHVEYVVADADGAVLGTETQIDWTELPAEVRAAAEKHFGTANDLTAMKGVENGKTTYEIAGTRGGLPHEATFDPFGKLEQEGEEGDESPEDD